MSENTSNKSNPLVAAQANDQTSVPLPELRAASSLLKDNSRERRLLQPLQPLQSQLPLQPPQQGSSPQPAKQSNEHPRLEQSEGAPIGELTQDWHEFSEPVTEPTGASAKLFASQVLIDGMHCSACALNVERAVRSVPGVHSVQVNAASHRAQVIWDPELANPAQWFLAIKLAGYRASPAVDWREERGRNKEGRLALWRLLVAGFCMMQVMMYTYPAYIAKEGEISADMTLLLRWASWVLTLPVMVFSCTPFWKNAWRDIKRSQISMDLPVALGLLITFAVSTASTFDDRGIFGNLVYFDSLTMFVFFLLASRWLEVKMRNQTAGSLEKLTRRLPVSVERLSESGEFTRVSLKDLKPGDVVRTHAAEAFPCDGEILEGDTWVEEALMTGESKPIQKTVGHGVLAGSHNLSQSVLVRVKALGKETRFAEIVKLMEQASLNKPNIVLLADRVATPFLWVVLALATLSTLFWWLWGSDPSKALMIGVSVLIVTCPCALSLAAPAAMLAATGNLARHAVYIRDLNSIEKMALVDHTVFDKTGTLTRDSQRLLKIFTPQGMLDFDQDMNTGLSDQHLPFTHEQLKTFQWAKAIAQQSWHPLSRALSGSLNQFITPGDTELDLSPSLVTEVAGQGLELKGKLPGEANLSSNGTTQEEHKNNASAVLRLGSSRFCNSWFESTVIPPQASSCQVHLVDRKGWRASFLLSEDIRVDALVSVQELRNMGLGVELLSGDQEAPVQWVAKQLQLAEDCSRAKCTPSDKLARVSELQKGGKTVATIGDGFNDMPALAKSDVSFAFGQAVPFAQAKADVVVLSNQLWAVPQTILLAQKTMRIVKYNFIWAGLYNFICIPLAVMGWLPPWASGIGMALSSTLVVLNSLQLASSSVLKSPSNNQGLG